MQIAVSRAIQGLADETSRELTACDIWTAFRRTYRMDGAQRFELIDYSETGRSSASQGRVFLGRISLDGQLRSISGRGNGLISSVASALRDDCGLALDVVDYHEHAMSRGSDAERTEEHTSELQSL